MQGAALSLLVVHQDELQVWAGADQAPLAESDETVGLSHLHHAVECFLAAHDCVWRLGEVTVAHVYNDGVLVGGVGGARIQA